MLSDRQFGFRQFHSVASAPLDSTNEWFVNMDRGKINIAVLLDLQKAFDTINHDILLKKLDMYGMELPTLNLLQILCPGFPLLNSILPVRRSRDGSKASTEDNFTRELI